MKMCVAIFSVLLTVYGPYSRAQADSDVQQKPSYVFSVLPYRPVPRLEADFSPFLSEVNRRAPFQVSLKLSLNSIKYFELIQDQVADFAIVNPFDSVPAQDNYGYLPVLSKPLHRCKIITLKNNKIHKLDDLKDKKVGFASKRSPISFYSERVLQKHGLVVNKDYKKVNHKSIYKCLHKLVINKVDACTAAHKAVKAFKHNRNIEFKELAQCEAFPGMVFMAHKRVPQENVKTMKALFIKSQHQSKGKAGHEHKNFSTYRVEQYLDIRKHYKQWLNDQ